MKRYADGLLAFVLGLFIFSSAGHAQRPELPQGDPARTWKESDSQDGRWNEMEIGPFLASVLRTPGGAIAKGLSIKVGDKERASVCYDTKNCTLRCAWTGGFLKFNDRRYGITSSPQIDGEVQLVTSGAGWGDCRTDYRGLYQNGESVVVEYEVGGTEVLEHPWCETRHGIVQFVRTFNVAPHDEPLSLTVMEVGGRRTIVERERFARYQQDGRVFSVAIRSVPEGVSLQTNRDVIVLRLAPAQKSVQFKLWMCNSPAEDVTTLDGLLEDHNPAQSLVLSIGRRETHIRTRWPQWIKTGGTLGKEAGPLAIDTVNVPFDNPHKALMFTSGFDFFESGDIAVCTLHGDVWLVRGVDDDLSDVKWKRYATGLCQPLGLKIVDDKIYVLGKDQITRLHDRNGDDEADFYECFNNQGQTSLGGHDYAACLETDAEGNFYYIRAHEGVCRVSPDGKQHESIATGFRNPIGLGVSPDGMVTAAPQEGNWTPSSAIFAVKEGGYYGFGGPRNDSPHELGFDPPLCWLPRSADNSSGGQVWVTSDDWALPRGTMLHLSYGLCTALVVMPEEVETSQGPLHQSGVVKLPLFFESGACRGRFSPHDGQLYVCGLMGWQTAAAKDGCLQRVRYSGKPLHVPVAMNVRDGGIAITFNHPLDPKSAADPGNYYIEQWNYKYSKEYGSKDYRASEPKRFGRDEVFIDDVQLTDGNRTVFLKLEEIAPVMQMGITYQLKAADGTKLNSTIYNTIHAVP